MNKDEEVLEIYRSSRDKQEKIHLLEEMELDMTNELAAQEENMQPEFHNKLSEGLRLAKNFLRELRGE